jgi:uncharacterized protein
MKLNRPTIALPIDTSECLTPARTIVLHLLPGVLLVIFYTLTVRWFYKAGLTPFLALCIGVAAILIPFELGYLLFQGRKRNGTLSLRSVIRFLEPMPWWHYLLLFVILFGWSGFIFGVCMDKMDKFAIDQFFRWVPDWFFLFGRSNDVIHYLSQFSKPVLVATAIANIIINGIAGPVVEELYFRGFLLPRLARFGGWAPLLNALLFSLYHFFSPWENPGRILALVPMIYAGWWKRNIYIGIMLHCAGNLTGAVGMLVYILNRF